MKVCLAFSRDDPFQFTSNQLTNPNLKTHHGKILCRVIIISGSLDVLNNNL